jgi:uncharacterized protein (TIGR00661 family)
MAKILYGVHGTGHGHAIRALAVARHYPQHEFLFVSHGDAAALLRPEFRVEECPNPETPVRFHQVAIDSLIRANLRLWHRKARLLRGIEQLIRRFKPDVALTDYEFFVPLACRNTGVPCLSLDHQHIITTCSHRLPFSQLYSYFMTSCAIRFLFSSASHFLVTSFYRPDQHPGRSNATFVPPLFRESIIGKNPMDGDHVVAYQGYSTFKAFLPFLRTIRRPVMVYGFDAAYRDGNLQFKKYSEEGFLQDLSSCSYIICGGGHSLISEALFYGKPVISVPITNAFEQFLNAYYLEKMGYGRMVNHLHPEPGIIPAFEDRLDQFKRNIAGGSFYGNDATFSFLDHFIRQRGLIPADIINVFSSRRRSDGIDIRGGIY